MRFEGTNQVKNNDNSTEQIRGKNQFWYLVICKKS